MVEADTLTPITPPDNTQPSQHQQAFVFEDTNEDIYHPKAKKALDFTDPNTKKLRLKQKAIIVDEDDEPPTKKKKNTLSPSSEED